MHRIAIANSKGGSCKTTTAVSLAAELGARGKRVLLIDCDPLASASQWTVRDIPSADPVEREQLWGQASLKALSTEAPLAEAVVESTLPGVQVVPTGPPLMQLQQALESPVFKERVLAKKVDELPPNWDVVIFDCKGDMDFLNLIAFIASTAVLVPLEATGAGIEGVVRLLKLIREVGEANNGLPTVAGILLCRMHATRILAADIEASLKERFPELLFPVTVPEDARAAEVSSHRVGLTDYAPKSRAAIAYAAVASELLTRLEEVPA